MGEQLRTNHGFLAVQAFLTLEVVKHRTEVPSKYDECIAKYDERHLMI